MTCHILSNSILFISCCEWCNEDQHSCSENIVFCALQAGRSWNGGRWNSWVSYWNSQSPHDSIDQWHCIQMCEHTSLNRWFHQFWQVMLESGKFDGIICDFLESFGEVHVEVWRQVWWLISWCDDVIGRLVRDSNIVAWIQYYASCFF